MIEREIFHVSQQGSLFLAFLNIPEQNEKVFGGEGEGGKRGNKKKKKNFFFFFSSLPYWAKKKSLRSKNTESSHSVMKENIMAKTIGSFWNLLRLGIIIPFALTEKKILMIIPVPVASKSMEDLPAQICMSVAYLPFHLAPATPKS